METPNPLKRSRSQEHLGSQYGLATNFDIASIVVKQNKGATINNVEVKRAHWHGHLRGYRSYEIHSTLSNTKYRVKRRYSDFHLLYQMLVDYSLESVIPPIPPLSFHDKMAADDSQFV